MKLFLLLLLLPFASASYVELFSGGNAGYCYANAANGVMPYGASTSTTVDLNACAARCGNSTMMTAHGGFFIHNGAACVCGHSADPIGCTNWQSIPDGDTSYKSYKIAAYEELQSGYCNNIAASEATTDTTVQGCYDRCLPLYYEYFLHSTAGNVGVGSCLCGHTTDPDDCSDWEDADAFTSYKILDPTPAPASPGCTDSGASNYDAAATEDGSCECDVGKGRVGLICEACTGNTFSAADDLTACETQGIQNCPQGQRFVSGGNSAPNQCLPCGEGTYQAAAGHTLTTCDSCGAGHHTVIIDNFAAEGAFGCTLCNPQTHWDDDGVSHTACLATNSTCDPGLKLVHSNDNELKNLCIDCDPNTYSAGTNSDTTCTPHSVTSCTVGDLVVTPSAATDGLCCAGDKHLADGACVDDTETDCAPGQGFSDGGGANDGSCTPCVGEFSVGTSACQPITVTKCYAGEGLTAATNASDGSCAACSGQFSDGTSACQDYRASCLGTEILSAVENGVSDKVCVANVIYGCTESDKLNYDPSANVNAGCGATKVVGCTDANYLEYDAAANFDVASACETIKVEGCTTLGKLNYDALASVDDGSCVDKVEGCMDEAYVNYDASANFESGHCAGLDLSGQACGDLKASYQGKSCCTS